MLVVDKGEARTGGIMQSDADCRLLYGVLTERPGRNTYGLLCRLTDVLWITGVWSSKADGRHRNGF